MALWLNLDKVRLVHSTYSHNNEPVFACWLALILYGSTLYYYMFQSHDPWRCQSLLNDGFWLDPMHLQNWQPNGCMIHTYKSEEVLRCFQDSRVVFIGGSRSRDLFDAALKRLDRQSRHRELLASESNREIRIGTTKLVFFWDTGLNGTEFRDFRMDLDSSLHPTKLVVVGLDDEFVRRQVDPAVMEMTVENAVAAFGTTPEERARRTESLVILPALSPGGSFHTGSSSSNGLAAAKARAINEALWKYSGEYEIGQAIKLSWLHEALHGLGDEEPGPNPLLEAKSLDVILNHACNKDLPKHYPYSSTCCNSYPTPGWVQLTASVIPAVLLPTAIYLLHKGHTTDTSALLRLMPHEKNLYPLLVMGAVALLCWLCDRTQIFEKAQKQISPSQFFASMGLIILGSLTTLHTSEKESLFLNRDQTDEWKGWMQVAILVYHYVGVSKTDWIYSYMRVCPTSYLFMTGFGHTVYFLKKGDYSSKRISATMLRLNLLNVLLAYTMGNDWLLYYFAPLVTWNFFVVYSMLWVGHQHNQALSFLLAKIAIFAAINRAIYHVPGILESIWWVLQTMFRMQGDLRECRFRVTLDQYSILPGMLAAIIFLRWDSLTIIHKPWLRSLTVAVAALIMPAYAVFEATLPSKFVYNTYHPYTGWMPCVAFVILRNSTPWLRRTHNALFAWFGRGSLETFLLQFHIWLAADTAGLLVLPGLGRARALNAFITTSIFLWVASKATEATGPIIAWLMASDSDGVDGKLPVSEHKGSFALLNAEMESAGWLKARMQRVWLAVQTDFRVRIAILLGLMVVFNWTYYL